MHYTERFILVTNLVQVAMNLARLMKLNGCLALGWHQRITNKIDVYCK
jgi:hypothetical protein